METANQTEDLWKVKMMNNKNAMTANRISTLVQNSLVMVASGLSSAWKRGFCLVSKYLDVIAQNHAAESAGTEPVEIQGKPKKKGKRNADSNGQGD